MVDARGSLRTPVSCMVGSRAGESRRRGGGRGMGR